MATSTYHSETSHTCVWLRRMINHIQQSCGIGSIESPTIIYEDNVACVAQMQTCYIKSNITKHIAPKLFYPHITTNGEIDILQTKSCDNLTDLFTKSLPTSTFQNSSWNWYATTTRFARFRGSHLLNINMFIHHIALFSFMSFSYTVSHIRFLMRQYLHKNICHISYFPYRGF